MTERGRAVVGLPLVPGRPYRGPARRRRRVVASLLFVTLGCVLFLFRAQLGHVAGALWGAELSQRGPEAPDTEKLIGTLPERRGISAAGSRREGPRESAEASASNAGDDAGDSEMVIIQRQEEQNAQEQRPEKQQEQQQVPQQQEQTSTERQHEGQEGSQGSAGGVLGPAGLSDAVSVRPGFAEAWKGRVALEASEHATCHELLESLDRVNATRDFNARPVRVHSGEVRRWDCDVPCEFSMDASRPFDGDLGGSGGTYKVLRSMEAASYYAQNNPTTARQSGFDVVMTVHYYSDVPVQYGSWEEYDIMRPLDEKDPYVGLAAAFISNCAANNFRLQALEALKKVLKVDSYGRCGHNMGDVHVDKQLTLNKYKFSLAFENSCEEDYVTEKFWQSLVAGAVPVVIGAPDIHHFAPNNHSYLHLKGVEDVDRVAKEMQRIADDNESWRRMVDWKWKGPSVDFLANMDISTVHSSCRLCIFIADKIVAKATEGKDNALLPCRCLRNTSSGSPSYVYHIYVRERFTFNYITITLDSSSLSLSSLKAAVREAFASRKHMPIWATKRPKSLATQEVIAAYKIYRIYPAGLNQKDVLHSDKWFHSDETFLDHLATHPCPYLEVIFV